jgi:hypothetical protein
MFSLLNVTPILIDGKSLFDHQLSEETCNPSWTITGFIAPKETYILESSGTYIILSMFFIKSSTKTSFAVIRIVISDESMTSNNIVFDISLDLQSLVYLGNIRLQSLKALPLNALIISTDSGLFVTPGVGDEMKKSGINISKALPYSCIFLDLLLIINFKLILRSIIKVAANDPDDKDVEDHELMYVELCQNKNL